MPSSKYVVSPYSATSPYSVTVPYSATSPYSVSSYSVSPYSTITPFSPTVYVASETSSIIPAYWSEKDVFYPTVLHPDLNLNEDPAVQLKVSKHFLYKTLDSWLYDDLRSILTYFVVENGKVRLISSLDKHDPDMKVSESDAEKIISFIEKEFLSTVFIFNILKRYIKETKTNWYDLHKNSYFIKDIIKSSLKKSIKKGISKK